MVHLAEFDLLTKAIFQDTRLIVIFNIRAIIYFSVLIKETNLNIVVKHGRDGIHTYGCEACMLLMCAVWI